MSRSVGAGRRIVVGPAPAPALPRVPTPALAIAVALAIALTLCGCSTAESPGGGPAPVPTSTAEPVLRTPLTPVTARELLEYCPAVDAQHFDGDIAAVLDVHVCSASDILSPNGDTGTDGGTDGGGALPDVQRASRVISGRDALLAAYSAPNAPATTGACIQLAADPLIVWVSTAAGITPVYAPVDECGFPSAAATDAVNGVELETILEIRADPAD